MRLPPKKTKRRIANSVWCPPQPSPASQLNPGRLLKMQQNTAQKLALLFKVRGRRSEPLRRLWLMLPDDSDPDTVFGEPNTELQNCVRRLRPN